MNPHSEIWAPIPGTQGLYAASTQGRIRSVDHITRGRFGNTARFHGQERSPSIKKNRPRSRVVTFYNGRKTHSTVGWARAVLSAFDPNLPPRKNIIFRNGNHQDFRLANLTYHGQQPIPPPQHRINQCPKGHNMVYPHIVIDITTRRAICRTCINERSGQ